MKLATVVVVGRYAASSVSGIVENSYLLAPTELDFNKFSNIFDYLESFNIIEYVNNLSGQLNVNFRRFTFQYKIGSETYYIILFHAEMNDHDGIISKHT